jgi:hypothetical protein
MTVGKFIIEELQADSISIQDKLYNLIFNKLEKIILADTEIKHNDFVNHTNHEINKLTIDLISNEHVISDNWVKRHKIYTGVEKNNLKKTAEKAILSLKLQHIEFNIEAIQNNMKSGEITIDDISLLKNLIEIKKKIASKIGRGLS